MKNKNKARRPAVGKFSVLAQLCKSIPGHVVAKLAREHGVEDKARTFTPWSHVMAMLYAHLTHAIGLNDVCDSLNLHRGKLAAVRAAVPPSRNGLSHANKVRSAGMAEALFWQVLEHLQSLSPSFGHGRRGRGLLRRFKAGIHAVDATVIELVASCLDWASHRRRKAAAKMHTRLDLHSWLPSCVIVDTARHADVSRVRELCAGLKSGEIVIYDRGFNDYAFWAELTARGVFWVTRARQDMTYRVVKRLPVPAACGHVLKDEMIVLTHRKGEAGDVVRRVEALVEVQGKMRVMVFLTNNTAWSPATVCDLYRSRWDIEVFFKQLKQTFKLCDFLGHSANAVRWQVWTALLAMLLLRFQAHLSRWGHSFSRLFSLLRAALWTRWDLRSLLGRCGTASGAFRLLSAPHQSWLPSLEGLWDSITPPRRLPAT